MRPILHSQRTKWNSIVDDIQSTYPGSFTSLSLSFSFSISVWRYFSISVSTDISRFPQPSTERNARNKILSRDKHTQADLGQAVYIVGMRCRRGWAVSSQAAERLQAAIMSQLVNRETLFWKLVATSRFDVILHLILVQKFPSLNIIYVYTYMYMILRIGATKWQYLPSVQLFEIKIITLVNYCNCFLMFLRYLFLK